MAEIQRFCNVENLQKKAAELIKNAINAHLQDFDVAVMAICGGSSVAGIFAELVEMDVRWSQVHFFMVDERLVPLDDPESNFKLAMDKLFKPLIEDGRLNEENLHPFRTELDIEMALAQYDREYCELGGEFTVTLLSAGPDGHIASLFPNHPSVMDDDEGFIEVSGSPKPPARRMSASRKQLEGGLNSILVVAGQSKAETLAKIESENGVVEDCPARMVLGAAKAFVLTDIE